MKTSFKQQKFNRLFALAMACFFSIGVLHAQQDELATVEFEGKVVDKEKEEPVVFANVYIENTSIGTVTNADGGFTIKIPHSLLSTAKLTVAHIGFENFSLPVSKLNDLQGTIALTPSKVPLKEVVVRTDDPVALIKKAIENVPVNYSVMPEMQTGFYRETVKKNNNYVGIAEAVMDIYKTGYTETFDTDRLKIYKGRKSRDVKRMDTVLFKFQGGPRTSLMLDLVKESNQIFYDDFATMYEFELDGMVKIDDRLAYAIRFDQKDAIKHPLYSGKVFLDAENLAFIRAEFRISEKRIEDAAGQLVRKKPSNMKIDVESAHYLVKYRQVEGKWYLNHVRAEASFRCKWDKQLFRSTYATALEMVVTDRHQDELVKFKLREAAKTNDVFAEQVEYYEDEDFWGDYNTIKPDESIEVAIEKLNRKLKRRMN